MRVRALQEQVEFAARKRMNVAQEVELVPVDVDAPGQEELCRQYGQRGGGAGGRNDGGRRQRLQEPRGAGPRFAIASFHGWSEAQSAAERTECKGCRPWRT